MNALPTNIQSDFIKETLAWAEQAMFDPATGVGPRTDSPVEAQMLVALHFLGRLWGDNFTVGERGRPLWPDFYTAKTVFSRTCIIPQFEIGPYRVDFAIFYSDERSVKVVVECDGHDFHERTKEQAQRDKARDRYLQDQGYKVLRYTGSEIYRQPLKSARQVIDVVYGAIEEAYGIRGEG